MSTSVACLASAIEFVSSWPRFSFVTKSSSAAWMLETPWRPMVREPVVVPSVRAARCEAGGVRVQQNPPAENNRS